LRIGKDQVYITKRVDRIIDGSGLDMAELFMRIVFSYVVGNSDMHLKNFSMIETGKASGEYVLSPAYDLLPVNSNMPEDEEECALALNGKKANLTRSDFLSYAEASDLSEVSAEKMIAKIVSMREQYIQMCEESLLPEQLKKSLAELIESRFEILAIGSH